MSIKVENLTYIYMKGTPYEKAALANVSFEISDGEFTGIIGRTGSGKSTLIQHFNGLLKPASGKVAVNGIDTAGKDLRDLRRHVGIVFQYPEHQLFDETVLDDVAFGIRKAGVAAGEVNDRVIDALRAVGLNADILKKSPFELSGGQKRRVAIAGVLVMEPDIIVLDEPTAGLDPRGRDEIFDFIGHLHDSKGNTVILVSHSMEDVARLARRVIVMDGGHIEMDGPVGTIFNDVERLERMGLAAPQVNYLMKRLAGIAPGMDGSIFTVREAAGEILRYLASASASAGREGKA